MLGAQWGDEGKGKLVDLLVASEKSGMNVCRCQVSTGLSPISIFLMFNSLHYVTDYRMLIVRLSIDDRRIHRLFPHMLSLLPVHLTTGWE